MDKHAASGSVCADEALLVENREDLTRWAGLFPASQKERLVPVLGHDPGFPTNKRVSLLPLWHLTYYPRL